MSKKGLKGPINKIGKEWVLLHGMQQISSRHESRRWALKQHLIALWRIGDTVQNQQKKVQFLLFHNAIKRCFNSFTTGACDDDSSRESILFSINREPFIYCLSTVYPYPVDTEMFKKHFEKKHSCKYSFNLFRIYSNLNKITGHYQESSYFTKEILIK